ncbi:MAG: hypothetical protein EPN53_13675 [Acidobacteria bacterium]|nr:MAG: hypothetical protein EPN53_13675 [Acidobacteriota bacterium]
MSWRLVVPGCALPLVFSGCVVTRAGTLTAISDGRAIPVTVAVKEESATVRGIDPKTGETLTGVLEVERPERPPGGLAPAPGAGPHIGIAPVPGGPVVMVFVGRLEGDRGTNLKCRLEVERRLRLRGGGVCRLADGDDPSPVYRLSLD